ncbi:MAG TPA: hypothetical protein VM489_18050 [Burkholderiales bacterium]|nr:hypothetical protein [Burkholderiales bacterium]
MIPAMKRLRFVLLLPLAGLAAAAPAAPEDEAFGHALTLVQVLVRIAAHAEDPQRAFDAVLAGRDAEANRAAAGLLEQATADLPPEQRSRVASIGHDLLALTRKAAPASVERSLQARKDLTAMGLRYYDSQQFLDAVGRDDRLAVELFLQGGGVDPQAKDAQGRSAFDIARGRGHTAMVELLARSRPAAR